MTYSIHDTGLPGFDVEMRIPQSVHHCCLNEIFQVQPSIESQKLLFMTVVFPQVKMHKYQTSLILCFRARTTQPGSGWCTVS